MTDEVMEDKHEASEFIPGWFMRYTSHLMSAESVGQTLATCLAHLND